MNTTKKTSEMIGLLLLLGGVGVSLGIIAKEGALGGGVWLHYGMRGVAVVLCLMFWFRSQALIGSRACDGGIGDGVHALTAPLHRYLSDHPRLADRILIVSSACIDGFAIFLLFYSILGPSMRPFVAFLVLFVLRQACQGICALPAPPGMIWRDPGFPSLLVTYDVGNDFFFSGHTAIAMLGAIELARISPWLGLIGGTIAFLEACVVLVMRAHYTMDVLTAIAATWCAVSLTDWMYGVLG